MTVIYDDSLCPLTAMVVSLLPSLCHPADSISTLTRYNCIDNAFTCL